MTDEAFNEAMTRYTQQYKDEKGRDGAIYIVDPGTGAQGLLINDPEFEAEFRTRMDGNQTPVEGTVVAVLG